MAEPAPLHELLSRIAAPDKAPQSPRGWPLGTMQWLNQRLAGRPFLGFLNAVLRGVGQVGFANNPASGLLILAAMFIQSPWLGTLSLIGVAAATLAAMALRLDPAMIQNGIFGLNGLLVGATLALTGSSGNGPWNPAWVAATIVLSALATLTMTKLGTWFATRLKAPPLGVAFNGVMLAFVLLIVFVPQTLFDMGPPPPAFPPGSVDAMRLAQALPVSLAQVYFSHQLVPLSLIVVAVGICTPTGLGVALLGCAMYLLAGLLLGARPDELYLGLWGYNGALAATAIGGVFYTPNRRSIAAGALCAFLASAASILMARWLAPLRLPVLCIPFTVVTIGCLWLLRRSLPSLVPVALHAVASPEEHRRRHAAARAVITPFRRRLTAASRDERRALLFEHAPPAVKDELRRAFDAIDRDGSGALSPAEVAAHLTPAGVSPSELSYLFDCMDLDGDGRLSFAELGELLLRHRRLMSRYEELRTYFLPIDADGDDVLSVAEMNASLKSVGEPPLSPDEVAVLRRRAGGRPFTWSRFIEALLLT